MIYSSHADAPNSINKEGQEISLKFKRTSDTTGILSWNIPPGVNGCAEEGKYDGILLTVADKPVNYISTSPQNQKIYNADPSVDPDIHSGDKLDFARVVGVFYNDRTTTVLEVTDLKKDVPYFFSAYALDNVFNYFRQGVHSYSLPSGPDEPNGEVDLVAVQDIGIDSQNGISPSTLTGLSENIGYILKICINNLEYTLNLPGNECLDFDDLIYKINQEFIRLTEPKFSGPNPPNTGSYYVQKNLKKVSLWDGFQAIPKDALFYNNDPSNPPNGAYWFNPEDEELQIFNAGSFSPVDYVKANYDFTNPKCNQYWFDGTFAYKWEKKLWCQLPTFISETNPLIPVPIDCNNFWYNTDTGIISERNTVTNTWVITKAIYSESNPNMITSGQYWYDQIIQQVKVFSSSTNTWNILNNVVYAERNNEGEFPGTPFANQFWFIPSEQLLQRRNPSNTAWVELSVIIYDSDPRDRESCELWWDQDADLLYIWDIVNTDWIEVDNFYQTNVDPASPIDIPLNSAWFNPTTEVLVIINNPDCDVVDYVFKATDPTIVVLNDIWYNPDTNIFKIYNGSGFQEIDVIIQVDDPFDLDVDDLWYNTASDMLNKWNGTAFVQQIISFDPLTPKIGDLWFDEDVEKLYEWNGTTWVETIGIAAVKLILKNPAACTDCRANHISFFDFTDPILLPQPKDIIRFYTKKTGCTNSIEICMEGGESFVFSALTQSVVYFDPIRGYTAGQSPPMYLQVGVGDDGSPDEIRKLHASIRSELGAPSVTVELTKEQIDESIMNGISLLRQYSSYSVKRGYFFLDLNPNQQIYYLKDKCVGFNKITEINAIHRFKTGFFGRASNDIFGYAALQQLYSFGTFDILSYHLVASYVKELERIFAENIMFQWIEEKRELRLFQTFTRKERVLLESYIEKPIQTILTQRETSIWHKKWAIAECKMKLAQVRGKYASGLPSASGGGLTLNASDLMQQAQDEMEKLMDQLLNDFSMQDLIDVGARAHMIVS